MTTRKLFALGAGLAALLISGAPGFAADATQVGALTIEHPWSRPTDALAQTGAIYLVVKNASASDDRLVAAATPAAGEAGLHMNMNDNGMIRMMPMDAIEVPAHGAATLKPGGYHIMLTSLKAPLKAGATYPLTLTFEKAGAVTVQVRVERGDSASHMQGAEDSHGMKHADAAPMHESMDEMKH
jgi:copper(I)-binding protein